MQLPNAAVGLILAVTVAGAEELRGDPQPGSFDVEPPMLPGNLVLETPDGKAPAELAQLTRKLARARQSAAEAKRLVKLGVLAQVEAENRALRVLELEADLAKEQLAVARAELERDQGNG